MERTIVASALATGTARESAEQVVGSLKAQLGSVRPRCVLVFPSTKQPLGEVSAHLDAAFPGVPVLGASTAGEFTESGDAKGSVAALALSGEFRVFAGIGEGVSSCPERAVSQALEGQPRALPGFPHCTAIMLIDPLAARSEEAAIMAASALGEGVRIAGGAAGDDLAMACTKVAINGVAASDALVIALVFSKRSLGVGVAHGHEPISPPLLITRSRGAIVEQIEGRPAWDVWREHTRERAAKLGIDVDALTNDGVGAFLLRYEAGLATGNGYKIRAPLVRRDDGSIQFACEVPEGSVIRITESLSERQIGSAREAARQARAQLDGLPAGALVFDCICRNLILGDEFGRATGAISAELGDVPIAGFETYGEIALDVGDMSGFHNTTSVVLVFPEG